MGRKAKKTKPRFEKYTIVTSEDDPKLYEMLESVI